VIARLSCAAVGVPRTVGGVVGAGAVEDVRARARGVGFGAGPCWGADAVEVGDAALGVGDEGPETLALAGTAELDSPLPAVGSAALRSFTRRAVTRIPMPMRATMATAAARPRRCRGWGGS
jgi:hypothetical protein